MRNPEMNISIEEAGRIPERVRKMAESGETGPSVARWLFGLGINDLKLVAETLTYAGFLCSPIPEEQGISVSRDIYNREAHPTSEIVKNLKVHKLDARSENLSGVTLGRGFSSEPE